MSKYYDVNVELKLCKNLVESRLENLSMFLSSSPTTAVSNSDRGFASCRARIGSSPRQVA